MVGDAGGSLENEGTPLRDLNKVQVRELAVTLVELLGKEAEACGPNVSPRHVDRLKSWKGEMQDKLKTEGSLVRVVSFVSDEGARVDYLEVGMRQEDSKTVLAKPVANGHRIALFNSLPYGDVDWRVDSLGYDSGRYLKPNPTEQVYIFVPGSRAMTGIDGNGYFDIKTKGGWQSYKTETGKTGSVKTYSVSL
jgi:hypothetical protein